MNMKVVYDWSAFESSDKRALRTLAPVFVMAPRELSQARMNQLVKQYLSNANIVIGVAEENYVAGFDAQPQFRTMPLPVAEDIAQKVAAAKIARRVVILRYPQAAVDDVVRKLKPKMMVIVRGSYQYVFHRRSTWHVLQGLGIPHEYVSPFVDDVEAKSYLLRVMPEVSEGRLQDHHDAVSAEELLTLAGEVAKCSFDYSYQVGCVVADQDDKGRYRPILSCYNQVIPYQTYALHHGNSREEHLSLPHDTNYYDTIHAEMNVLVNAMKMGESLVGKSLFIPLLPCPNCARTLSQSGIKELIYERSHSEGYAIELLESCGISVVKMTLKEDS